MTLPTATVADLISWGPCWPRGQLRAITSLYEDEPWTALDVLDYRILPKRMVSDDDRLWVVLREKLIPAPILHEFACRCAERALSFVRKPDPRCSEAIRVKRAWLRGEATGEELKAARKAISLPRPSAAFHAVDATYYAASNTTCARLVSAHAAYATVDFSGDYAWQVKELRKMLRGAK